MLELHYPTVTKTILKRQYPGKPTLKVAFGNDNGAIFENSSKLRASLFVTSWWPRSSGQTNYQVHHPPLRHNNWNCAQISSTVTTFHCHRFATSFYFIRLTPYLSRVFEFSFFVGLTVEYGGIGQSYLFEFIERMCPRRTYKNNRSNSRELHTYRSFDENPPWKASR